MSRDNADAEGNLALDLTRVGRIDRSNQGEVRKLLWYL